MSTDPRLAFSAVVATKGRSAELVRLLDSLAAQDHPVAEIIIVDQNEEDILSGPLEPFGDLPIKHIRRTDLKGVNANRNHGWQISTGDVAFFPDDDCWYPAGTLSKAAAMLEAGADIASGRAAAPDGRSINGRFLETACAVDDKSAWFTQIEWVFFIRRPVLDATGGWDEAIGPGAGTPWGANEVQDLSLAALARGFSQSYDPGLFAHHAEFDASSLDAQGRKRARHYARGVGYVLAKHGAPLRTGVYWGLRPLLGAAAALLKGQIGLSSYRWMSGLGRLSGYLAARRQGLGADR